MSHFDHFNFIGPFYDRIFGRGAVDEIVRLAEVDPSMKVLDLGGGTGRVAISFKPRVNNIQVGDSAYGMLQMAREKGLDALMTHSEHLPYRSGSFDRVILVDAFHHVADQSATLKEMWRVLSPDGKILIEEPDISNFWVKLIALGEKILLMRSHFLRPDAIAAMGKFDGSARVDVRRMKGVAWVIISKDSDQNERSYGWQK